MTAVIDHIVVLMLENRSFDHLFAFSGLAGLCGVDTSKTNPGASGDVPMSDTASDRPACDPKHEFEDVDWQIYRTPRAAENRDATLTGFVDRSGPSVMQCVPASTNDVLTQLGRQYCVCDHWFSSMPGPTWPNRFFVHAGSSGGLANSPSGLVAAGATLPDLGFGFRNGTIYDRLTAAGKSWRIYHGDHFPQVCAIDGMPSVFVASTEQFRSFDQYASDMAGGDVADYTFIEPDYSILTSFRDGNSQHPLGSLSQGEQLIKAAYDALRESSAWNTSMLIVLYDEHGGFYDQIPPPAAVAPDDDEQNAGKAANPPTPPFAFDRLGIRVPAVVVSPWITPGTVSHAQYDHTSIIRTVFEVFQLQGQLTARDAQAISLVPLLNASLQASPGPAVTAPIGSAAVPEAMTAGVPNTGRDSGSGLDGYTRIAAQVHHALLHYRTGMQAHELSAAVRAAPDIVNIPGLPRNGTADESRAYIAKVAALVGDHRRRQAAAP